MPTPQFRPFTPEHADRVASWPLSAAEAVHWCGATEYPVPARTILDWQPDTDVVSTLLITDGMPVGYGELWIDAEENEVELARIIVDPAVRGKGLGRALVRHLLAEARKIGYADVFLRVHPENDAAERLYRTVGFVPVDPALAREWNAEQPHEYTWLRYGEPAATSPDADKS